MELDGKIALVTGAAKRVGKAIAIQLARCGADIALHYNQSSEAAHATAAEISSIGRRVELFQADLAQPAQIEQMFQAIAKTFSRLDVLVNNAAIYHRTPLDSLSAGLWDAEFAVNARAPALCISQAIALMPAGGVIVNITDVSADRPRAGWPAYCASKAALLALTKSAARALAGRNIRVNSVAPGLVDWPADASEADKSKLLAGVPMRRSGDPHDIAQAVAFLIRSDYITGQNLRVDGGWDMA
jgi:pteridine reductase